MLSAKLLTVVSGGSESVFSFADVFDRASGAIGNSWQSGASTWTISGGYAINTPVLGAERLTTGDFAADANWTKGTGWTISGGAAHIAGGAGWLQQGAGIFGRWAKLVYTILNRSAGSIQPSFHNTFLTSRSSNGTYAEIAKWGGSSNLNFIPTSATLDIDDVSAKLLTSNELFAVQAAPTSDVVLRVKLHARTTGAQAGLVLCLDSTSNPQNYVIIYLRDGGVTVEKCVAGTFTTVATLTIAFAADAELIVSKDGSTWKFIYNNNVSVANFTISDAGIVSNLNFGMFSTDSGNQFEDFSLQARIVEGVNHTPIINFQGQFHPIGDSKTWDNGVDGYPPMLAALLTTNGSRYYIEAPSRNATPGFSVADIKAGIDAKLATYTTAPHYVLFNLGVNDTLGDADDVDVLGATAWKANLAYILDAVHTKWPNARVYLMRAGKVGNATVIDKLNRMADVYMPDVISTRAWCHLGPDERIFLGNGDNYATYTYDGIHPNMQGYAITATQWKVAIGL